MFSDHSVGSRVRGGKAGECWWPPALSHTQACGTLSAVGCMESLQFKKSKFIHLKLVLTRMSLE